MAAIVYCVFDDVAGPIASPAIAAKGAAIYRCSRCDVVIESRSDRPIRKCRKPLTLAERAVSIVRAGLRWGLAGMPRRPESEILRILEECCRPCRYFEPTDGICRKCGCCANEDKQPLANKLAMATEHCPIHLW